MPIFAIFDPEGGGGGGGAWAHIPEQRLEIEPVVWVPRTFEDTYL